MSQIPNPYAQPQQMPYGQPQQAMPQAPYAQPQQAPYGQPQQAMPQAPYAQPQQAMPQAPYAQPQQAMPQQMPYGQPQQAMQQAPYAQPQQMPYGQQFAVPSNTDVLASLGNATTRGTRFPYLPAGTHTMELVTVAMRSTQSKGELIAIEWKAVHSSTPEVQTGAMYGETFFVTDVNKVNAELTAGRLKSLICAAGGLNPQDPDPSIYTALLRRSITSEQPLTGKRLVVYNVPATSRAGKGYMRSDYTPVQQVQVPQAPVQQAPVQQPQQAPVSGYAAGVPFVTPAQLQAPVQFQPGGGQPQPGYAPGSLEAFQAQFGKLPGQ